MTREWVISVSEANGRERSFFGIDVPSSINIGHEVVILGEVFKVTRILHDPSRKHTIVYVVCIP